MSARSSPRGVGVEPMATATTGRRCTVAVVGTPVSGAGTPTGATDDPVAGAVAAGVVASGAVRGAGSGVDPQPASTSPPQAATTTVRLTAAPTASTRPFPGARLPRPLL